MAIGVVSLLGRLFGSDKARDSLIEGAVSGLDKLVYTDEERAEDQAKSVTEARSMVIEWLKNTQGQNLSRRIIALSVTAFWLVQIALAQVVAILAVFADDKDELKEVAEVLIAGAAMMDAAVMLILGFYFAAPYMGKIAEAATNRFVNKGVAEGVK